MPAFFYDDVTIGSIQKVGDYQVSEEEILEFGRKWDPLPIHVDIEAAKRSPFGGLTAPGSLILAIKQKLVHDLPLRQSVVCSLGFDKVRFRAPLRPGDRVYAEVTWLSKRLSESQPGCGIVDLGIALRNTRDEAIVEHTDTILIRLRAGPPNGAAIDHAPVHDAAQDMALRGGPGCL